MKNKDMKNYLVNLDNEELNDLFLQHTKRFINGLEHKLTHKQLSDIRNTIKEIVVEIDSRKHYSNN